MCGASSNCNELAPLVLCTACMHDNWIMFVLLGFSILFVSYSVSLVTEELGMEITNEDTTDWYVNY